MSKQISSINSCFKIRGRRNQNKTVIPQNFTPNIKAIVRMKMRKLNSNKQQRAHKFSLHKSLDRPSLKNPRTPKSFNMTCVRSPKGRAGVKSPGARQIAERLVKAAPRTFSPKPKPLEESEMSIMLSLHSNISDYVKNKVKSVKQARYGGLFSPRLLRHKADNVSFDIGSSKGLPRIFRPTQQVDSIF